MDIGCFYVYYTGDRVVCITDVIGLCKSSGIAAGEPVVLIPKEWTIIPIDDTTKESVERGQLHALEQQASLVVATSETERKIIDEQIKAGTYKIEHKKQINQLEHKAAIPHEVLLAAKKFYNKEDPTTPLSSDELHAYMATQATVEKEVGKQPEVLVKPVEKVNAEPTGIDKEAQVKMVVDALKGLTTAFNGLSTSIASWTSENKK